MHVPRVHVPCRRLPSENRHARPSDDGVSACRQDTFQLPIDRTKMHGTQTQVKYPLPPSHCSNTVIPEQAAPGVLSSQQR